MKTSPNRLGSWPLIVPLLLAAAPAATATAQHDRFITTDITVNAPRADVWTAWTTTDGVRSFFAPAARVELRAGGPFEVYFDLDAPAGERGSEGCVVQSFVLGRVLSVTWNAPPQFINLRGRRTFVVVTLDDAEAGGTHVQLTHGGWGEGDDWDQVFEYFSKAWPRVLENLQRRFDEGPLFEPVEVPQPELKPFVYFLHPARPDFPERLTTDERTALVGHVGHIRKLLADARLVLAGPCDQPTQFPDTSATSVPLRMPTPGIVVFNAQDAADAKRIMEADPAVAAGVFEACVMPFTLSFHRP